VKLVLWAAVATLGLGALLLSGCEQKHEPVSNSKVVPIDAGEWSLIDTEKVYARNFQRNTKSIKEPYSQIVTIFDIPMTIDRRVGHQESEDEYIEIFTTDPFPTNRVVVQVRLDKGGYWILSRQVFMLDKILKTNPIDDERTYNIVRSDLQNEIDATRYQVRHGFN
jgi:hypothetical protein